MILVTKNQKGISYKTTYVTDERRNWLKKFKRFLIEFNAYDSYLANAIKQNKNPYVQMFDNSDVECNFISHCFTWAKTDEGRRFWCILHCIWSINYCKCNANIMASDYASSSEEKYLLLEKVKEFKTKGFNIKLVET